MQCMHGTHQSYSYSQLTNCCMNCTNGNSLATCIVLYFIKHIGVGTGQLFTVQHRKSSYHATTL